MTNTMEAAGEISQTGPPGNVTINVVSRGGILVNADFEKTLAENGLEKFGDFYSLEPEEVVKHVRDERMTCRVTLRVDGAPKTFYLKKTAYNPWRECWRAMVKEVSLRRT